MEAIHRYRYRIITLVMISILFLAIPGNGFANSNQSTAPDINAKSGLAIDSKTKQILYSKNAEQSLPAASTSKLLSIYIILQRIHSGQLNWDQPVKISPEISSLSQQSDYTNVPLQAGHTYSVKDLYQASLIYSANGAVMALAEQVSGSQPAFVDQMKKTAQNLGIHDAKLYNACGLTNNEVGSLGYSNVDGNAENSLSANDLGIIASNLVDRYPEVLQTTSIKNKTFNGIDMRNWNWMLNGNGQSQTDLPVDGLKTGTSNAAGANFVGTTHQNGHRIITVVMHAPHNSSSDPSRFIQTQKIMNYVYSSYRYVEYGKDYRLPLQSISVPNGKRTEVAIQSAATPHYWQLNSSKRVTYQLQIAAHLKDGNGVSAPLKNGERVGNLSLPSAENRLNYLENSKMLIPIQVNQKVDKANFFVRGFRSLANLF